MLRFALAHTPTGSSHSTSRRVYRALYAVPGWQSAVVVTLALGIASGIAAATNGRPLNAVHACLAVLLSAATITDLFWRRIFHSIQLGILGSVLALRWMAPEADWVGALSFRESAIGVGVCGGAMVALYLVFRGGEGDVKLIAALGAALGPWHGMEAMMFGYMLAAVVGVVLLSTPRFKMKPVINLPMAPFFTLGVVISLSS